MEARICHSPVALYASCPSSPSSRRWKAAMDGPACQITAELGFKQAAGHGLSACGRVRRPGGSGRSSAARLPGLPAPAPPGCLSCIHVRCHPTQPDANPNQPQPRLQRSARIQLQKVRAPATRQYSSSYREQGLLFVDIGVNTHPCASRRHGRGLRCCAHFHGKC